MSETRYDDALAAAEDLSEVSDEELFTQLGLRIEDMKNVGGYDRSQQYSADFEQDAEDMLSMDDLKKIGRRWWAKLEPQLMKLLCDGSNPEMAKITSGKTVPQIAASLATAAVVSALAPPAWIVVGTSIVAAKIADTGLESFCEVWRESLG